MTLPVITQRDMVRGFFQAKLGLRCSDDFRGVCHLRPLTDGESADMDDVAIAVGYDSFIGRACCMHVVIPRPELLTRRIVREAFEFPFIKCDCEAVLGLVDSVNDAALTFDTRLGFREIARIPGAGLEGDLVVLCMQRAQCKWLRPH